MSNTSKYPEIAEIKVLLRSYLSEEQILLVDEAWQLASEVHHGEKHYSGDLYIYHLVEVFQTLASMQMDLDTVLAGVLHGVLRTGKVDYDTLVKKFGEDVAVIVDGMSRITRIAYNSKLASKADNMRKMLLAIATDIRVLLVRLVDRLQDMFHLDMVDRDQQISVAQETMDIYAPLASRLGIEWLKRELEDLSFRYLYPDEYEELESKLKSSLDDRQRYVDEVTALLKQKLVDANVYPLRIYGRPKHLYSIYKKLIAQNIPFEKVYDKVAFRIIVNSIPDCYGALGIIHSEWSPIQERIKDFISVPKANNYQSMHTTVLGPKGQFIEIQIRTEEMDLIAQEGIAAHWAYKEGGKANKKDAKLFRELKKLVSSLQEVEDPREFMDSLIEELYDPEVFALTPTGEVKELPLGSCPIDFAYTIHSDIGDHCVGAKVGDRHVPLKYQLQNGDVVEIITSATQFPKRDWLDIVKTSRARTRIRSWLRREEKEKSLALGRETCDRETRKYNTSLKKIIKSGEIQRLLDALRCNSLDDFLIKVGTSEISPQSLAKVLTPKVAQHSEQESEFSSLQQSEGSVSHLESKSLEDDSVGVDIDGIEGMLVKISRCCNPLPGDEIVGFITVGRGVSIHKLNCPNLLTADPDRRIDVSWTGVKEKYFQTSIHINAESVKGLFAEVAGIISTDNAKIINISAHTTEDDRADITLVFEVENLVQLKRIMQHIQQLPAVFSVRRL